MLKSADTSADLRASASSLMFLLISFKCSSSLRSTICELCSKMLRLRDTGDEVRHKLGEAGIVLMGENCCSRDLGVEWHWSSSRLLLGLVASNEEHMDGALNK
ncbi:hypothetical protein BpHYR1_053309 [Brachionus plicatilis]|uniref:Uncharacterized protein n=1 Tax=Brachionus plicatilis TaxID=10195 RepID=A0A3M7T3R8_BRAPC|nr:hypothetical protein BpHYR1_053309 [Brachionus plicatilis]